jgi:pimeloyl-ACP methyl ester carboxylesterase
MPAWLMIALGLPTFGLAFAVAFVVLTYLGALRLTGGKFGWPGFRYFWHEALCTMFTQWIWPYGWFLGSGFGGRPAAGGGRPIVVVHGWTQNRTNFVWLARFLRRKGLGPFFGFNYNSYHAAEKSAKALGTFVERVRAHTGADKVDLICHSFGGLVARVYVDMLEGHRHVRQVVTLGSPHRGVAHANPSWGPSVRDMHAEIGIARKLAALPLAPGVGYTSIYSAHDNIVFPGSVSCLGERGTDIGVAEFGHFGILFCTEVADHVCRALTTEASEATQRAQSPTASLSPA